MAKDAVVLFGAGASMDAGLPSAFTLTNKVYDSLVEAKSPDARLFAIIIAKLQLRGARQGRSPQSPINVEEVYEALKKFLGKDQDILAEFVQSWEEISGNHKAEFNAQNFLNNLSSAFELSDRRSLDGRPHLHIKQSALVAATNVLSQAFHGEFYSFRGASLEPFLHTLSILLNVDDGRIGYMKDLLYAYRHQVSCLATLNYDRLVEKSLESRGNSFDLGLSQWNEKRFVRFHGQSLKLIKLHGSLDWFIRNQDEIIVDPNGPNLAFPKRAMIFGGQDSKLVPFGPFLHLRHEFQRFLRDSNKLLISGYSFGDDHLNAILRSWVATRRNAKMMVINPSGFDPNHAIMSFGRQKTKTGTIRNNVSLEVVEKRLSDATDEISSFLAS